MYAIETSMLRTAPAQAAVAGRIGLSAIPADMLGAALLHAENLRESELFLDSDSAQGLDSEGMTVM